MKQPWFSADLHLDHARAICHGRPFKNVDEMNETIIERWNERVPSDGTVYLVGDVTMKKKPRRELIDRLNGSIHLITGNHDHEHVRKCDRWASVQPYLELKLNGQHIILFHYPMMTWNRIAYGSLHLHGHCHGTVPPTHLRCDVGVDAWDYYPASFGGVLERLKRATPHVYVDYHRPGTEAE